MTDEAMSPLRRRMIEDMTIRKLASRTADTLIASCLPTRACENTVIVSRGAVERGHE